VEDVLMGFSLGSDGRQRQESVNHEFHIEDGSYRATTKSST
jgi:hypothetical protein